MTDDRRTNRMVGCACLGKGMLASGAVVLAALCLLNLSQCFFSDRPRNGDHLRSKAMINGIRDALSSYEAEYHAFPILTGKNDIDTQFRSRGSLITELFPLEVSEMNFKKIHFIDLPMARNRKFGLWQDGSEWVISDVWGEPFHIILDTNENNVITNPEFGADQSNPDYAKNYQNYPPSATLPATVIIYSSGPDRDPKTWHDNICSWRN
jgi:hypothetical protein